MSFILDAPKSDKATFIFWMKSFPDGRLKYPVKAKVHPGNWENQRVKDDKDRINTTLSRLDLVFQDLQTQSRLHGKPLTKAGTEAAFNKALGRNIAGKDFFEVIDKIIDERESGKELTRDGKRFSAHTIKGYRHTRDNLNKFNPRMTFEGVTIETYKELIAYFNENNDHAINTIGKIIKNWKVFMRAAKKRGAHENLVYLDEDFKVPDEETDDIYLTDTELKTIYEKHYVTPTLDLVRDWFIIDCYTGLRISDIQLLDAQHILKDRIRLVNEKTDTKVVIPIHPYVKAILKKHDGLPRKITDQKMNENIKKVCEIAGINEPVLYSVTKGGKRKDYHLKKYEMVSNHTARRCFITNLLNAGVPDNQVMQLAGIKKHATLLRYKKTKPEETASIMQEHPFFKKKTKRPPSKLGKGRR
jgi:integrase